MKKTFLFFILSVFTVYSYSQISLNATNNSYSLGNPTGVDYLFFINRINLSDELEYSNYVSGDVVNWYRFDNPSVSVSNLPTLSPDGDTGYILIVNGKKYTVWVIDYADYLINFSSMTVSASLDPEGNVQCDETKLILDADIPRIFYTDSLGTPQELKREFAISYQTFGDFNGENWPQEDKEVVTQLPAQEVTVETPLKDTEFILTGDQFAEALNIELPEMKTGMYYTVQAKPAITTITSLREEPNEDDRPDKEDKLEGSAPLYILFKSNPSNKDNYYGPICLWTIYESDNPIITRNEEDHRYTFHTPGKYKVLLELKSTGSDYCILKDSVEITVRESDLQVPNVFTPNGDGKNDEFRVAYRSLESYECWVYNNWGNLVYHGTNPDKGWDGKIRGKNASPGAYFYIIQARGTDGIKYKKKGDINLIR